MGIEWLGSFNMGAGVMYRINVKEKKACNPWLVALCVLLALSTAGFACLAVRNARPFTCEHSFYDKDNHLICEKILQ